MPGAGKIFQTLVVLGSLASVHAAPRVKARQAPPAPAPPVEGVPGAVPVPGAPVPGAPGVEQPGAVPGAVPGAPGAPPQAAGGLTDTDILQFALTLEHLESTFYQQGFQRFPDSEFQALGLSQQNIDSLKGVGQTEAAHVSQLMSAIAGAGAQPVQPCTYNFGFTTAQNMVATARVLEAVGVSAYLGAAPLVQSRAVLSAAGQIVTVEARHQTFIRTASQAIPVPNAFDTPLGPRAVFTLASQFIQSCPQGSNLNIQPFPAIALQGGGMNIREGQSLVLQNPAEPQGAQFCAFIDKGQTMFSPLTNGNCAVPQNMSGEVYMMVTRSQSATDDAILAGPSVIIMS